MLARYVAEADAGEINDLARAMAVELTVEVPEKVIDRYPHLNRDLVACIEGIKPVDSSRHEITLSFAGNLPGADLTRWLNLLLGNCSMLPGVTLADLEIPEPILQDFTGPRFGIGAVSYTHLRAHET